MTCKYQNCSSLTSVKIPNGLKSIDSGVFRGCSGLTTANIPESVQGIGVQAFADCTGLTSVDISSSVTTIAARAFQNCGSLADVYCRAEDIPETGGDAFEGTPIASATLYVTVGSIDLYKVTVPWSEFGSFVILPININEKNFPDTNFRKWLLNKTEYGKDGMLMHDEISEVTVINVKSCSIVSLKGIEFFFALKELTCSSNNLAELDMSGCPTLEKLDCASNKSLTSLNVSKNKLLNSLICDWNTKLTVLDVSQNTELKYLNCERNNFMVELYLPKGPALTSLRCRYTKVTKLDVSGCTGLPSLDCSSNKLTSLDVSGCTAMTSLNCSNNNLVELKMTDTPLTSLNCQSNNLTLIDLSMNTGLKTLQCGSNKLTSIDLSNNTALNIIDCNNNQLTTLDVSKNTALTSLNFSYNNLAGFDLSANTALTSLNCSYNPLMTFDVSKNTVLTSIDCNNSQLTALDLSHNTELETLRCGNNSLKAIDVSKNTKLKRLECYNNQLTRLDVSECNELKVLQCYLNQIKDAAMDLLVESLPTVSAGDMNVFSDKEDWPTEQNVMTTIQVSAAKAKGWRTYIYVYAWDYDDLNRYIWENYSGSRPNTVVAYTAGQMATIILPTEPDASKGRYYRLDRCEDNLIVFMEELQPQARTPYIIVPDEDFSIDRSTLDLAGLTKDSVSIAGISFIGSYIGDVLPAFTGGEGGGAFYIDIIDSTPDCLKAKLSTEKSVVGALRAYLQVSWDDPYNHGGTKGEPSEKMGIVLLDEGTGIDEIQNSKFKNHNVEGCAIYDLSGRKVNSRYSQRPEGIYIKGGKKFIAM